jgi:VIT1/CCC1 family predicted Fe2+/Mn2+ transporter
VTTHPLTWPPRYQPTPTRHCRCTPARNSASTPQDLPSPLLAGVSSLFAFSAGALVPLLPYLFGATVAIGVTYLVGRLIGG